MSGNDRRELCAECGGQCCRSRPGAEAPERFLSLSHDEIAAKVRDSIKKNRSKLLPDPKAAAARDVIAAAGA